MRFSSRRANRHDESFNSGRPPRLALSQPVERRTAPAGNEGSAHD